MEGNGAYPRSEILAPIHTTLTLDYELNPSRIAWQVIAAGTANLLSVKYRRGTRDKIAHLKASQAEVTRSIKARTMSVSRFAEFTLTSPQHVRAEIEAGTIPTTMVGNRRHIRITPEIKARLGAGYKKHMSILALMEEALKDVGVALPVRVPQSNS